MTPDQEHRMGTRAAFAILATLCALCLLASMSGCLTATKIHRWESALVGWARKGDAQCVESVKVASTYLVNANRTLQGAKSGLKTEPTPKLDPNELRPNVPPRMM